MLNAPVLKSLIREKNLNQTQLARKTGIRQNTLSRYINGVSNPDSETVKLLASALKVPVEALIITADKPPSAPKPPKRQLCFCPNCGVNLMGVSE